MSLFQRHCGLCNVRFPKAVGQGVGGTFCSSVHYVQAWGDWVKSYRGCRFIRCDCPGDRWHERKACRNKAPRQGKWLLDGRCIDCGHYPEAHGRWRSRSSFNYGEDR